MAIECTVQDHTIHTGDCSADACLVLCFGSWWICRETESGSDPKKETRELPSRDAHL